MRVLDPGGTINHGHHQCSILMRNIPPLTTDGILDDLPEAYSPSQYDVSSQFLDSQQYPGVGDFKSDLMSEIHIQVSRPQADMQRMDTQGAHDSFQLIQMSWTFITQMLDRVEGPHEAPLGLFTRQCWQRSSITFVSVGNHMPNRAAYGLVPKVLPDLNAYPEEPKWGQATSDELGLPCGVQTTSDHSTRLG